jgi:cobalamin biosynthetic protein CobC
MSLTHGGNLLEIARRYNSSVNDWLDLSTGVSPFNYPVGKLPESVWHALPQANDGLERAAQAYYKSRTEPIAVAGSQAAIKVLPSVISAHLGRRYTVALPRVGYKEHQRAWQDWANKSQEQGNECSLIYYQDKPTQVQVAASDVVVVINPNNPTGYQWPLAELDELRQQLTSKKSWLLVDEAFMDATPEQSLLAKKPDDRHLIVLRSVGKFFGLAGARVGFVFANDAILQSLGDSLGPWTVTGPSRWLVKQALADTAWQAQQQQRLISSGKRLHSLLKKYLNLPLVSHSLFTTVKTSKAEYFFEVFCEQRVLVRLCDEMDAIRLGLPGNEVDWQRLEYALNVINRAEKNIKVCNPVALSQVEKLNND